MQNNRVTLIGYVGKHLIVCKLGNGDKRVAIRLATHYYLKNPQGKNEYHTVWHDVVAWNNVADFAERHFVKGSRIMVDGSITYRIYPDLRGHVRYVTMIKANSLVNLDR